MPTPAEVRFYQIQSALRDGLISLDTARLLCGTPGLSVLNYITTPPVPVTPTGGGEVQSGQETPFEFSFSNYKNISTPSNFSEAAGQRVLLPVTPERIEISSKNNATVASSIAGFTFSHAGGMDLERVSFDSFFPAGLPNLSTDQLPSYVSHKIGTQDAPAYEPADLVALFNDAMQANQPVNFSVTRNGLSSTLSGNNVYEETPVTIVDFSYSFSAGNDMDVAFSMSLQRWFPQQIAFQAPVTSYVTRAYRRYRGIYVHGDKRSCRGIALRLLGDSARGAEIALLNKTKLSADYTARRRKQRAGFPYLRLDEITPGITLQIPAR